MTVAEKCFFITYPCRIQEAFILNAATISRRGIPHSGDREQDARYLKSFRQVEICLGTMADYLADGAPIELLDLSRCWEMYINTHDLVIAWQVAVQSDLNRVNVPVDDLAKLDALALFLFNKARELGQLPMQNGRQSSMFAGLSTYRFNMNRQPATPTPDQLPQYKSTIDELSVHVMERNNNWGG